MRVRAMNGIKRVTVSLLAAGIWFGMSAAGAAGSGRPVARSEGAVYQGWTDSTRGRKIPVKLYLPTTGTAPYPVVIFSHGLGGSREAAPYLGQTWADHGYLGVFIQHPGSDTGVWRSATGREQFMQRMRGAANGKNLIDRVADVKFVIDELERLNKADPQLRGKMDLKRIAVAGHSFGAGTALTIAGQNFGGRTSNDPRVRSAIYLCPPVMGRSGGMRTYDTIRIPGMLLTGTEDNSPIGNTKAEERRIPFDGISAPHQYLINFVGADHAVFGGRSFRNPASTDAGYQRMIKELTTRFLDATLKNDPAAWDWLDSGAARKYLGDTASYERK
jgi:predicted dienelactone hydrolase